MPINRRYPIAQVLAAAERFAERSGGLASINYVVISGVNDGADHASALAALLGSRPFSLQIVDLNPDPRIPHSRSSTTARFIRTLEEAGLSAHYSRQLGRMDGAGCGQLDADYPSRSGRRSMLAGTHE
jgi:23S rRNA (adenine2503-C2)-methyltransferase